MTAPTSPADRNDRRTRWARRETARRQAGYAKAHQQWQADSDQLDRMIATARSFAGTTQSRVILKRNERAYYEYPAGRLIEVQRQAGHYVGGYSGFSFRVAKGVRFNVGGSRGSYVTGAENLKITDEGAVTVTDQRVILQGSKNSREWAFSKLLGVAHDDNRPVTLMHVSNRQKVSGVVYAAADTMQFRFHLSLALAHFQGRVAEFVRELERERAQHAALAPVAPVPALPADAPNGALAALGVLRTVYIGRPGWPRKARVMQGLATAAITVALISAATGGTSSPNATNAGAGSALSSAPAATAASSTVALAAAPPRTTSGTVAPSTHRATAPTRRPSTTHRAAAKPRVTVRATPRATKAAKAKVVAATCGAPANPWGYNFCDRGHLIYKPKAAVCDYFGCISSFWDGSGYMTQCNDGEYGMSGGRQGACSHHHGEAQPVYSG